MHDNFTEVFLFERLRYWFIERWNRLANVRLFLVYEEAVWQTYFHVKISLQLTEFNGHVYSFLDKRSVFTFSFMFAIILFNQD